MEQDILSEETTQVAQKFQVEEPMKGIPIMNLPEMNFPETNIELF